MLKSFAVKNYRNFQNEIYLDLSSGKYTFNTECIENKIDKIAIIYGYNATGKSNLMKGLFDIVYTLTDFEKEGLINSQSYQNVYHLDEPVSFSYNFTFDDIDVIYQYTKSNIDTILAEKVLIGDKTIIDYDKASRKKIVKLEGAEKLKLNLTNEKISIVKYIVANSVIKDVTFKKIH